MFRHAAIVVSGAVLLVGSALGVTTAEAGGPHDRPAPLMKIGKFRHDFSPNKDGFHEKLNIPVTLSRRAFLRVRVVDLDTKTVLAHANQAICLDGKCPLARGTHTVRWPDIVHVFDRGLYAGDPRGSYRLVFYASTPSDDRRDIARTVVTWRDPVDLDNDAEHTDHFISPNGDGRQDRLRIGYDVEQASRVRAVISNTSLQTRETTVVDRLRVGRQVAGHHTWTWSPAQGSARPADGSYSVTLVAVPLAQRPGTGRATVPVTVDTVAPDATTKYTRTTVYPATTLFTDEIRLKFGKDVVITSLDASVRRADGTLVRALKPQSIPCVNAWDGENCPLLRWDGRDAAGAVQPAGSYVLRAIASDVAGNQAVASNPLTVSDQPLVEHTKTTTLPAVQWGPVATPCSYPGPQICLYQPPVASDRFPGGLSFRSGSGPWSGSAAGIFTVQAETGHEQFRVTATGGPATPGDPDTALLNNIQMQGDGSFTTPWLPITLSSSQKPVRYAGPSLGLMAQGAWNVTTGNDYDVASFTVEQTYFAPAS
jgi:hypothetical protein